MKNALVIGFGSIGKLHARVLSKFNVFDQIYILTSQKIKKYKTISSLDQIKNINPNYIVIASETSSHYKQLLYLDKNFSKKKILIEKPIFHKFFNFKVNLNNMNQIFIGYNLRFHPVILFLKKILHNRKILSVNIFCGSYLPNWRKERNYQQTNSAKKNRGGGVLLDLSHELDYLLLLFGKIRKFYSINKKISNLKIDTDDFLNFIGISDKGIQVNLTLNYFSLIQKRELIIDCNNFHIVANLINNELKYYKNKKIYFKKFRKFNREETYKQMHYNYLYKNKKNLCNIDEALTTMKLIDKIKIEK